ncbi:MAG: translation initiation factor IF-2 [Eubacterium sp.]|nr:translation initiation factor IF-2 [Eubacterium sp.]
MAKIKVIDLARELGFEKSKEIIEFMKEKGVELKAQSGVEEEHAKTIREHFSKAAKPKENASEAAKPNKEEAKPAQGENKVEAKQDAPKKKNISVVFNSSAGKGRGQKPRNGRPMQGKGPKPGERQQPDGPRPKKVSRRLMEAQAADRAKTEESTQPKPQAEPKAKEPVEEVKKSMSMEKKISAEAKETASKIVRGNIYDNAPKKQAPANKNSGGDRPRRDNDRRSDGQRQQNNQGRHSKPAVEASADAPMFEGKERRRNNPSSNGNNNNNNNNNYKNKKKPGRLDKSERTFSLEKTSGHKKAHKTPQKAEPISDEIRTIQLPEKMMISELADILKVPSSALVKKLFLEGQIYTINSEVDYEKAEEIALEYNCIAEPEEKVDVIAELLKEEEEDEADMTSRPPVVCVMGHVDHGKTSLLDAIRDSKVKVTDKEAGGITQAIGAYMVEVGDRKITFLDTPGHEAFTAMRMRGANSTDIAVLVVAADDGVMPQTVEAINHAKAAGIEIIVAINKIDKPSANVERVKQELSEYELIPEDWGGSTVFVPVSAHTKEGIDELLDMILLTADVLELKANPKRSARGLVIEAKLDKGKGVCATVLVQKGTLKVGQPIAAGEAYGKVRAMTDELGRRLKEAGPSVPVEIQGLSSVPRAGEIFISPESDKEARNFAETFQAENKKQLLNDTKGRMSLDDLFSQIQAGNLKELELIIKADVQGSVEALKTSLEKLSNEEVVVKVIHSGVGAITESDVILATASNAIIIGFNVRPDAAAKNTADSEGVDIKLYKVIYNAIEDVEAAMKGMLDPVYEEKVTGHLEILQIFKASGVGNIGGSIVTDGNVVKDSKVRVFRDGDQIFEGQLASLKRFKDDVKEVKSGSECGIVIEEFDGIQVGDTIEAYIMEEVPR